MAVTTKHRIEKELSKLANHLRWFGDTMRLTEKKIDKKEWYMAKEYLEIARHRLELTQMVFEKFEREYELDINKKTE